MGKVVRSVHLSMMGFLCSMPSILRNNRFRRDARSMDEDEELWFDQEDDYDEQDPVMPMTDMLKAKLDNDFDQIGKFLERSRSPGRIFEHYKLCLSVCIYLIIVIHQ